MSRVYKCDRCGNIMDIKDYLTTEYEIRRVIKNGLQAEKTFDLCPECCVELESWLGEKNELEHIRSKE